MNGKKEATREDFFMETGKPDSVSKLKLSFRESLAQAEVRGSEKEVITAVKLSKSGKDIEKEVITAVKLSKGGKDIPNTPLSKRFSEEESQ